jgi:hypothetical protein
MDETTETGEGAVNRATHFVDELAESLQAAAISNRRR